MQALLESPAVAVPEEDLEQHIEWISQTKLAPTLVTPLLVRLIKTIRALNHLSFTKLEFLTEVGFPTGKKYIVFDRQARNDCYFLLRVQGVFGVRVSVRTRHAISPRSIASVVMLYEEKRKMETGGNVVQMRPSAAPAKPPAKKSAPAERQVVILEPETPLGFYEGNPIPEEWLRYFYRHLKRDYPNRPAFISTQDLMPLVKMLFGQGFQRSAVHYFFKTEIASFAKKTAQGTGWEFRWKSVSDFIHGEPHPPFPKTVEKTAVPVVPDKELDFVGRVLLSKRRPEFEAKLQELQCLDAEITAQMEALQIRKEQIRAQQLVVKADLERSILSPQDEENLMKLKAVGI